MLVRWLESQSFNSQSPRVWQALLTKNSSVHVLNQSLCRASTSPSMEELAALSVATTNLRDDSAMAELPLPDEMVYGEKGRPAFEQTDSAALDFFFQVVPDIQREDLHRLVEAMWQEDATTALRLIFQTGNARRDDGGKMDRGNFYRCLIWLWEQHPETLLLNLAEIPKHTCLKDLLELLVFAVHARPSGDHELELEGALAGKRRAKEHRDEIRTGSKKRERRTARNGRRKELKEEFAATLGKPLGDILLQDEPVAQDAAASTKADRVKDAKPPKVRWVSEEVKAKWDDFVRARDASLAARAKQDRRSRQARLDAGPTAEARSGGNGTLQRLYAAVADIFAEGLREELRVLSEDPASLGGLFGKWAPSVGGAHDKATRIVDAIADRVLVGPLADLAWVDMDAAQVAAARRVAFTRKVLAPLRAGARVPEHFVGKGAWGEVDYERMPSRCRLLYGNRVFAKHDKDRYKAFLAEAAESALKTAAPGEKVKKVNTGALLPHEVTQRSEKAWMTIHGKRPADCEYYDSEDESEDEDKDKDEGKDEDKDEEEAADAVSAQAEGADEKLDEAKMVNQEANLQWHGIVQGCKEAAARGAGVGCWVPVCDVSGSMDGVPMEVAIALSLLLAEVNTPQSGWHGRVFTFESNPHLAELFDAPAEAGAGELREIGKAVYETRALGWGGSTNIDATMDLFLERALAVGTPPAEMARQALVIFSDMEFDQAYEGNVPWETAHEAITAKFVAAGFPSAPLIIYWNLRASLSTPVPQANTPGVLLLAGFSAGLLRSFLEGNLAEFTPQAQLRKILERDAYAALKVAPGDA